MDEWINEWTEADGTTKHAGIPRMKAEPNWKNKIGMKRCHIPFTHSKGTLCDKLINSRWQFPPSVSHQAMLSQRNQNRFRKAILWALSSAPEMNVIKLVFKSTRWSRDCYILTRAWGLFWRTSWGWRLLQKPHMQGKRPLAEKKTDERPLEKVLGYK